MKTAVRPALVASSMQRRTSASPTPLPRAAGSNREHPETRLPGQHVLGIRAHLVGHVGDAPEGIAFTEGAEDDCALDA